jgi:hypothetical protein
MVFHSSKRFYESLAVAQQGKAKLTCIQALIFHSVIPASRRCIKYEITKNYQSGLLDDRTDADDTWRVWVDCPINLKNKYSLRV